MTADKTLLQMKYADIVALYAEENKISLGDALNIFYHSKLYILISEGVSDMHCMSVGYLAEELKLEQEEK